MKIVFRIFCRSFLCFRVAGGRIENIYRLQTLKGSAEEFFFSQFAKLEFYVEKVSIPCKLLRKLLWRSLCLHALECWVLF